MKSNELYKEMKEGIDAVIGGKTKIFKSYGISPSMVDAYLKELGFTRDHMETNGWQWDYWIDYSKGDQKYMVFGGGWDGKIQFSLAENSDEK